MISESRLLAIIGPSDHAQGSARAPVEWIVYGDYQCQACGKAYPDIKRARQGMTGSLKFAFRNFPLTQRHPDALNAAKAAEAAGLQKRFWQMHELLYENQDYLDYESLLQYAVELRMDANRFARDFRSPKVEKKILADFGSGVRSGVTGTPACFINGFRYDGDWSDFSLAQALQSAAEAGPA